jgi:polysaccharide pyruvyl transferase WcaK-like protein
VAGIILVHRQNEYKRGMHDAANAAIARLVETQHVSTVNIDTRLDVNGTGLRTPAEVESLIARMDVVITTRLHGMVLALKNGVPALVVDPIAGGAKIQTQAQRIGWSVFFTANSLSDGAMREAYEYCLTDSARQEARSCSQRAAEVVEQVREEFVSVLTDGGGAR